MPGPKLPTDVLIGRGNTHLSKAEEADRRAGEIIFLASEPVSPPDWLKGQKLRKEFSRIEELLRKAKIMSDLDADALARYVVAQAHWLKATDKLNKAFVPVPVPDAEENEKQRKAVDVDQVEQWSRIQDRFFKQAKGCAMDLGLTITSRCRLVVPQAVPSPDENPFEKMRREREERRNA